MQQLLDCILLYYLTLAATLTVSMISRTTKTEHDSNLLGNLSMTLVMGPAKIWEAVKAPKYFWLFLSPSGFVFQMFYGLEKPFLSHYRSSAAACWPCVELHCIFISSL